MMIIMNNSKEKDFVNSKKMTSFGTEQVSSFGFLVSRIGFSVFQSETQGFTNSLLFSKRKLFTT